MLVACKLLGYFAVTLRNCLRVSCLRLQLWLKAFLQPGADLVPQAGAAALQHLLTAMPEGGEGGAKPNSSSKQAAAVSNSGSSSSSPAGDAEAADALHTVVLGSPAFNPFTRAFCTMFVALCSMGLRELNSGSSIQSPTVSAGALTAWRDIGHFALSQWVMPLMLSWPCQRNVQHCCANTLWQL